MQLTIRSRFINMGGRKNQVVFESAPYLDWNLPAKFARCRIQSWSDTSQAEKWRRLYLRIVKIVRIVFSARSYTYSWCRCISEGARLHHREPRLSRGIIRGEWILVSDDDRMENKHNGNKMDVTTESTFPTFSLHGTPLRKCFCYCVCRQLYNHRWSPPKLS